MAQPTATINFHNHLQDFRKILGDAFVFTDEDSLNTYAPVSYTHLDVYKRQVTFSNSSSGAASYVWEFGDGTSSTITNPVHQYDATGTVSYTHLDVYKRQAWISKSGWERSRWCEHQIKISKRSSGICELAQKLW